MFKKIVIPVILLLFILQTDCLLSANEDAEVKSEVSTEAVAEAEASTEAVAEKEAKSEVSAEAVTETEAVAEKETKVEESTEAVAETETKVEESTEAVVETETKAEESTEAVAETEEDVIATVNGENIIRKGLDRRLNVLKRMNQDVSRTTPMVIVDQLAKKVLLKQFIEEQNIEVSDKEIQGEVEKIKFFLKANTNDSEKSLEEILEAQGSNIAVLEDEVRRTLALSKYLDKEVSDDEKRNYFDVNKSSFNGERVKASHVLIDTRNMKTEAELEAAKQKIENIKKKIDNGADFAEVAKKYSNCPSAEKGGDIGFFGRRGSIVEPFARVAFSMEIGEISEPVETQFGYHIIKVTEKEKGKDVSYEDVREMVDFVYMQIKTENLLESLMEKAGIEVFL